MIRPLADPSADTSSACSTQAQAKRISNSNTHILFPLPPGGEDQQMDHNRPLCDTPLDSGSQRASGNGTVPGAHPTTFCSPPAHRIQAQASSQPTIKWVATDSDTHSLEDEESGYVSHDHAVGRFISLRHYGSLTFRVLGIYVPPINDSLRFTDSRGRCTRSWPKQ